MSMMHLAGVTFPQVDSDNPRIGPPRANWDRIIRRDTLIHSPPKSLRSDLHVIGWLDEVIEIFQHLFRRGPSAP
jgi:hypothetical protein